MKTPIWIIPFLLLSCKSEQDRNLAHVDSVVAQAKYDMEQFKGANAAKNDLTADIKNYNFDTVGISDAPIKILQSKLIQPEYSTYKSMYLKYKNISGKKVSAIRFKWYGLNAFGEPADMGSSGIGMSGFGGGFTDEPMMPKEISSGTWNILSRDGKKIILAWPYEVAFSDGTKWHSARQ